MTAIASRHLGLLDFPPELRLHIFALLHQEQRLKAIHVTYPDEGKTAFKCSGRSLAITEVNRRIRDEAVPILLNDVTVFIGLHKAESKRALGHWISDVEDRTLAQVHSLHVTFPHTCTQPQKCSNIKTALIDLKRRGSEVTYAPKCQVTGEEVEENAILRRTFDSMKKADGRCRFSKAELFSLTRAIGD